MTERNAARRLPFPLHLNAVFPLGLLACLTFGAIDRAHAEDAVFLDRYAAEYTAGRADNEEKTDPLRSGPLFAVVSIADQRISVYGAGGLLARSSVSTGVKAHPTPTGVFSIVQKRRWHQSNIYSSAPMPLMQRITWSGIALHAGHVPGYPASHGCIRLPASFAQRMFGATEIGQRVIVAPSDTVPVEITHRTLPTPKLSPAPGASVASAPNAVEATASVDAPRQNDGAVLQPAGFDNAPVAPERLNPIDFARAMKNDANGRARSAARATKAAMLLSVRKASELRLVSRKLSAAENAAEDAADELTDAIRDFEKAERDEADTRAAIEKRRAEAAAVEVKSRPEASMSEVKSPAEAPAPKVESEPAMAEAKSEAETAMTSAKNQLDAAVSEAKDQPEAATEVKAQADPAMIEAERKAAAKAQAEATEREAKKVAEDARAAKEAKTLELAAARKTEAAEARAHAETALTEAKKALEEARAAKEARQQELDAARTAEVEAKAAGKAAARTLAEAARRLKPLSVFISRKTGRLYVRQNFEPLFDVPVSIRDADREIGTHVYVSTRAAEDGSVLHWQAVSMPVMSESRSGSREREGRKAAKTEATVPVEASAPETAQGALDRVTIPEDASQRLAELAWVGASVIISDNGISGETGSTTDFIILTRSRPSTR